MIAQQVDGVACNCGETFRSFDAWEDHRKECGRY